MDGAGRKLGDPSTLGPALRAALLEGQVGRAGADGRLDSARVIYRRSAIEAAEFEDEALDFALAERLAAWAGAITIDGVARWSGLRKRDAERAIGSLELTEIEVRGLVRAGPARRTSPRSRRRRRGGRRCGCCPSAIRASRSGRRAPLLSDGAAQVKVLDFRHKAAALGTQDSLHHHAVLLGDRVIGAWEVSPERRAIVWGVWEPLPPTQRRHVAAAIEGTQTFIREQFGALRSCALDANARRAERADYVARLRPPASAATRR